MTEQYDAPLSRNSDPDTSRRAAADAEKGRNPGQRWYMLLAFATNSDGLTDEEAMRASSMVPANSGYWKRASDLRNSRLIEVVHQYGAPLTRKGSKGSLCEVSRVTEYGYAVLAGRQPMPSPERHGSPESAVMRVLSENEKASLRRSKVRLAEQTSYDRTTLTIPINELKTLLNVIEKVAAA